MFVEMSFLSKTCDRGPVENANFGAKNDFPPNLSDSSCCFVFCLQNAWGAITDKFWTILALIEEAELWTQKNVVLNQSLTVFD